MALEHEVAGAYSILNGSSVSTRPAKSEKFLV